VKSTRRFVGQIGGGPSLEVKYTVTSAGSSKSSSSLFKDGSSRGLFFLVFLLQIILYEVWLPTSNLTSIPALPHLENSRGAAFGGRPSSRDRFFLGPFSHPFFHQLSKTSGSSSGPYLPMSYSSALSACFRVLLSMHELQVSQFQYSSIPRK